MKRGYFNCRILKQDFAKACFINPGVVADTMVLLRLGMEREARIWKSEEYKTSVRKYMETLGFSLEQTSILDGTLADMIFEPYNNTSRRAWVEAKNTEVSLRDPEFRSELLHYLAAWLNMPPSDRFEFRLFVREMRAAKSWEKLFSPKAEQEEILGWVEGAAPDVGLATVEGALENRREDIIHFFATSYVYEGDKWTLDRHAEIKESMSELGIHNIAERQSKEMLRRYEYGTRKGTYVLNLVPMAIPTRYRILSVGTEGGTDLSNRLRSMHRPPYVFLSETELLTIQHPDLAKHFDDIGIRKESEVTKQDVETRDQDSLLALMNICISRIVHLKGGQEIVRDRKHLFFFPLPKGKRKKNGFSIPSSSGRMFEVATPKFNKQLLSDGEEGLVASYQDARINHCFHKGFVARAALLWGDYYVYLKDKKVFTKDGLIPLEGEYAARLDEKYRKPEYNRSEAQLSLIRALAFYLFRDWSRPTKAPIFIDQFKFSDLVTVGSDRSPLIIDMDQASLVTEDEEEDHVED